MPTPPGFEAAKRLAKALLPAAAVRAIRLRLSERRHRGLSARDTFRAIYRDGDWGRDPDDPGRPFSGTGSHDSAVVRAYVDAVGAWADRFAPRLDAVDLGCGDFEVGSRLRDRFARYVACDIVPEVVASNQRRFADRDVEFRALDMAADDLPPGDVAFLRQVAQHLSNDLIARVLPKLARSYRYLVLSEHLPARPGFVPNLDLRTGSATRLLRGSGVVLTEPPFALAPLETEVLCEAPEGDGLIRTIAYRLR